MAEEFRPVRNIFNVHHAMEVAALDVVDVEVGASYLPRVRTVLAAARSRGRHPATSVVAPEGQAVLEDVRAARMARCMRHGAALTAVEKEWCGDNRLQYSLGKTMSLYVLGEQNDQN